MKGGKNKVEKANIVCLSNAVLKYDTQKSPQVTSEFLQSDHTSVSSILEALLALLLSPQLARGIHYFAFHTVVYF